MSFSALAPGVSTAVADNPVARTHRGIAGQRQGGVTTERGLAFPPTTLDVAVPSAPAAVLFVLGSAFRRFVWR
jgi:hypothetical protein